MKVNINMLISICMVLVTYLLVVLGILKSHVVHIYNNLSRKEKIGTVGLIIVSFLVATYTSTKINVIEMEECIWTANINDLMMHTFSNCIPIMMLMEFLLLRVPTIIIFAMAMKLLTQKCKLAPTQIYYFFFVEITTLVIYAGQKWSICKSINLMILSTLVFCIAAVIWEGYTKKKVLYIAGILIFFCGINYGNEKVFLLSIELIAYWIIVNLILAFVLNKAGYLRPVLRKIVTILMLFVILYTQYKVNILF